MSSFVLSIDNMIYNIKKIRSCLSKGVKLCAMVKADAYGHGLKNIAKYIEVYVDYFGVATIDEGVQLRNLGVKKKIVCVGKCDATKYQIASNYDIEITIEEPQQLLDGYIKNVKMLKVHLKIDTGMHRLGFTDANTFKSFVGRLKKIHNVKVVGIFTHFASLERSEKQLEIFNDFVNLVNSKNILLHCSNSSVFNQKEMQFNMVRVGIALYGYGGYDLKNVLQIESEVLSVRKICKGEYVGYGNAYKVKSDTYIATVFLGYRDGINRKLAGKAKVSINGIEYKIVGNICMDMFMVEVDEKVKVGDRVVVFKNADDWAKIVGTIPYEILTSLRYDRCEIIYK